MSSRTRSHLYCDGMPAKCVERVVEGFPDESVDELRHKMRAYGWRHVGDKDYCGVCSPEVADVPDEPSEVPLPHTVEACHGELARLFGRLQAGGIQLARTWDTIDHLTEKVAQYKTAVEQAMPFLTYASSPTMGLPPGRDALEFAYEATADNARIALRIVIANARDALEVLTSVAGGERQT